ncbi:MAG: hypothetical protein ABSB97_00970 [Thermoplasmata archaeon]
MEPPFRRSEPTSPPRAPWPVDRRPRARLPEPPAFRDHPRGVPLACANCAGVIAVKSAPPMCWGCGRPLCTECYWRHGLTPAAHRCTSCLARRPSDSLAISGARSGTKARLSANP